MLFRNSSKVLKFSIFEVETDEFSGKIISNRQLYILPPNIGKIVTNVSRFEASNVGLLAVNQNAFDGMDQLKVLNLSRNQISLIESKTFLNLTELKILDLSFNQIEIIEVKAFEDFNELEQLNLEHNLLSMLPSDTFESLLNLRILILSYNKIRELNDEIFTGINVVEEFYINNNELEVVNPKIVSDFETSKIIDFSGNFCIDQRFPDNLTMVQLAIEVSEKCRGKHVNFDIKKYLFKSNI